MTTLIESFVHAGLTVELHRDEDPFNPRKEFEHLTTIGHWHRRYDLGTRLDSGMTEETLREYHPDIMAVLPLYMYDHSGITINTEGFSCKWDSGQVGWIWITRENAENMGCEDWNEEKLLDAIRADVAEYDAYLTGQVYGYRVLSPEGKELDSCWGFIGDLSDCRSQARSSAESQKQDAAT